MTAGEPAQLHTEVAVQERCCAAQRLHKRAARDVSDVQQIPPMLVRYGESANRTASRQTEGRDCARNWHPAATVPDELLGVHPFAVAHDLDLARLPRRFRHPSEVVIYGAAESAEGRQGLRFGRGSSWSVEVRPLGRLRLPGRLVVQHVAQRNAVPDVLVTGRANGRPAWTQSCSSPDCSATAWSSASPRQWISTDPSAMPTVREHVGSAKLPYRSHCPAARTAMSTPGDQPGASRRSGRSTSRQRALSAVGSAVTSTRVAITSATPIPSGQAGRISHGLNDQKQAPVQTKEHITRVGSST